MFNLFNKRSLIFLILILGMVFKIYYTSNGNFFFHMDNARDMVDVREMVELKKLRLIGPTSGIEGLYNGPLWYYLMIIPYLIFDGDPYGMVFFQIVIWFIGGYFLLKIFEQSHFLIIAAIGSLWVSSNLLILSSQNSLSPNPIPFLIPVFVFYFEKFLKEKKWKYNLVVWLMAGLFFHLEMAFGLVLPAVILATNTLYDKNYFKSLNFRIGILVFGAFLLPQFLFELKHNFLMTNSVLRFVQETLQKNEPFNFITKVSSLFNLYKTVYSALVMNNGFIMISLIAVFLLALKVKTFKLVKENKIIGVCLMLLLIPLLIYLIFPIRVMSWHILGSIVGTLFLLGFSLKTLESKGALLKKLAYLIAIFIITASIINVKEYIKYQDASKDPSLFKYELGAVDYVFEKAAGKNFKVYIYMPSIIDYPYQYIFWWRGLNKYGYTPEDYAYLPNEIPYISNKTSFNLIKEESSGLIFLIKEPDRLNLRHLWENNFDQYPLIETEKIGSIIIETRLVMKQD